MGVTWSFRSLPPGIREEAEARAQVLRRALQEMRTTVMPRHKPQDIDRWMMSKTADLIRVITQAQLDNTALIDKTFDLALLAQGYQDTPVGLLVPEEFAGIMPDGDSLHMIPQAVANRVRERLATGSEPLQAWQAGGQLLATITMTALSDTSRMAKAVAGLARPRTLYVRMLRPPSCSRCAVLAGKRGYWSEPFQRHPRCDCTQVPVREGSEDDFTGPAFNAQDYYRSLSEDRQRKIFTQAGAAAIDEGADIAQVVNSRRGMATSGDAFTREARTVRSQAIKYNLGTSRVPQGTPAFDRLSVPQIIRQTEGDPQRRIAQLYVHGYLRSVEPGQRLSTVIRRIGDQNAA